MLFLLAAPVVEEACAADSTRAGGFSWRGRPLPECSSFAVTEFGLHYLLNRGAIPWTDRSIFLTIDLGYMKNRSERSAVGGLLHLGTGDDWTGFGPGVRYRRWLSKGLATDATVGLDVLGQVAPGGEFGAPAPWAEVGFSAADIVTVSLRGEHWTGTVNGARGITTWHLGAKGGSYLGTVGTVGFAVLVAIFIAAYAD